MSHARETTLTFFFHYVGISSEAISCSCSFHNFETLRHILIILVEALVSNSRCLTRETTSAVVIFKLSPLNEILN